MHKIGIDLGGTKTEGILLDDNFEIIERTRVKTNQQEGYSSILDLIKNLVDDLRQKTDQKTSLGISISTGPGLPVVAIWKASLTTWGISDAFITR